MNKLKNHKSPGIDGFPNEMFKTSKNHIVPVLHKLCNKILILGNFPRNWQISTLTPIHKKGPKDCTTNYRGIAVSNSLCKIFCSILNNRLVKYLEKHNIIPENQIGFRHGHRTADHVLTLKTIIDKYFQSKNMYTAVLLTLNQHLTQYGGQLYSTNY